MGMGEVGIPDLVLARLAQRMFQAGTGVFAACRGCAIGIALGVDVLFARA